LVKMKTFNLAKLPAGRKLVKSKWVYTYKRDEHGAVVGYKARLVIMGNSQIPDLDFVRSSSPVAEVRSFRIIFGLASEYDMELTQLDVDHAYLNAPLDPGEQMFMRPPPGYERSDDQVWHIQKALYGAHQSGNCWWRELTKTLTDGGWKPCSVDPCLFFHADGARTGVLAVHVDDMLIATANTSVRDTTLTLLKSKYSLKIDYSPSWFMHTHIKRDRANGVIYLDQRQYLLDVLNREGMVDCRPAILPMNPGAKLRRATEEQAESITTQDREWYRKIVGSVLWLCTQTRPDITACVRLLCQFVSNPTEDHKREIVMLLRYLKATQSYGIAFRRTGKGVKFQIYTDATWGSDLDDRKGVGAYIILWDGGLIDWRARKQPHIASSSMEAEICAASEGAKEAGILLTLLKEAGVPQEEGILLMTDSQSMITAAKNDGYHASLRHVDIRHKQIFEAARVGAIKLKWVSSEEQLADMLTKPLGKAAFLAHAARLITAIPST
jgi:hypothetical protein